jgi:hypothetical protein
MQLLVESWIVVCVCCVLHCSGGDYHEDIGLLSQIVIERIVFRLLKCNNGRGNWLILVCRLVLKECLEQT